MSRENVDTVRRGYERYAEGDLEGVAALFSKDAVVADGGGLGVAGTAAGTLHGPEGFFQSASESLEAFDDYEVETEEFIDAGQAVVVAVRISGKGKASGAELEMRLAHLWVIGEDGKAVRGEVYRSVEEALAAPGFGAGTTAEENAAVVRRAIAAINERDVAGYLACCTEDVELSTPVAPIAGVYEGPEGIARFFKDIEDAGPDFHIGIRELEAIGERHVLASLEITTTGRASGIPLGRPTTNLYEFEDGRIRRIRIYLDRSEALGALETSE
jgi:ketosteroid isomerase-like protein